ncbi:MAG: hypothetical protein HUJ51_06530 [Eggerthellaceae bacterium]|nr:hypothetical protein [Eggerthellaceae bacterium]
MLFKKNAITRLAKSSNFSSNDFRPRWCLSIHIDFAPSDFVFTTFNSAWVKDISSRNNKISSGRHVNATVSGMISSR